MLKLEFLIHVEHQEEYQPFLSYYEPHTSMFPHKAGQGQTSFYRRASTYYTYTSEYKSIKWACLLMCRVRITNNVLLPGVLYIQSPHSMSRRLPCFFIYHSYISHKSHNGHISSPEGLMAHICTYTNLLIQTMASKHRYLVDPILTHEQSHPTLECSEGFTSMNIECT